MTPVKIPHVFQGPPKQPLTSGEPSRERESDDETRDNDFEETTGMLVLFINEANLANSPQVEIRVKECRFTAILHSGSEVNLLSERAYEKLIGTGLAILTLPVEGVILVTAFGGRSKRIRQQALVEFSIGQDVFETIFLVSPQLNNDAILGCQFLREHGVTIDFSSDTFSYVRDGETRRRTFATRVIVQGACRRDKSTGQRPNPQSADYDTTPPLLRAADCCNGSQTQPTASSSEPTQGARHGRWIEPGPLDPERNQEFPDPDPKSCQSISRGECVTASVAACKSRPRSRATASLEATPTTESEVNSVETALLHDQPIPDPKTPSPDPRSLQAADLRSLVEKVDSLSTAEQDALYQVLLRYREHLTSRPGKCKLFSYRFQVDADRPIIGHSRPIPYALRPAVR